LVLVYQYEKAEKKNEGVSKKSIAEFYLANTTKINNWDLVDCSAPQTLGLWLVDKERSVLYKLAKSSNLWEKRIAIITTFAFIRKNQFDDTITISEILLHDTHDLIHKAVGWMVREVGKRDENELLQFLDKHYKEMPRTMLRYAIERLSKEQRMYYMRKS
jgi:3-methyladenine DNA glycosylase AlkD